MHKKDMHGEAAAGNQNPSTNMVCKAALVGRQHPNHKSEDLEVHTKLLEDARKSSAPANNHGWSIQWSFKCFNLSKTLQWCSQARADQLWDFHQALAGNFFPRWRTNSHSLWLSELYDSTFLVSERTIRERSWGTKGNFGVFSHIHMWTFWPEQPEGKHGSQHVWNHISEELLKINWVCASNSILRWFFSIINISHTAQRWVKQITLLTTKWNKSRLTSEKTSQTCARCHYPALPHCHPLGSATHAKDIRRLCACERARKDRSKFPSPAWQYHCS